MRKPKTEWDDGSTSLDRTRIKRSGCHRRPHHPRQTKRGKSIRPTLITYPDGSTEQFAYERLDLVASKDRAGRWTQSFYTNIRQKIPDFGPDARPVAYSWCSCGSLSKLTDPAGRVTEWKRDIQGRPTEKILPDGVTKTSYTYEPRSGRLSSVTNPKDQGSGHPTVSCRYFADGRLKLEDYINNAADNGASDVSCKYEPLNLGRLFSTTESLGTTLYAYLPLSTAVAGAGALNTLDGPLTDDRLQWVYDWQNRPITQKLLKDASTTLLRSETITTDTLGRTSKITNGLGTFTFGYTTALNRLDTLPAPSGLVTSMTYLPATAPGASARPPEARTHSLNGTPFSVHRFGYDVAGRIISWNRTPTGATAANQSFAYNASDELTLSEKNR